MSPSKLLSKRLCEDSSTYQSKFGASCSEHSNVQCEQLSILGWTQDEINDLLLHCPVACAVPECSLSVPTQPTAAPTMNIMSSTELDLLQQQWPPTMTSSTSRGLRSRQLQNACFPNWPSYCQDDPTYVSRMNVGCAAFQMLDNCFMARTVVSFTDAEVDQLITSCPCSCAIPCTASPTPAPITLPPVGPRFNEAAAIAAVAAKSGDANQTGSPDTIMVIIMSVGGAVAFFLCCFMCIFFVNRSRRDEDSEADSTEDMNTSRRRKKGGSGDADDRSDTSDLSDEFYDDDATKTTAKSSWAEDRKKRRQRRKKDNGKKGKGWSLSNIMPDMELCT